MRRLAAGAVKRVVPPLLGVMLAGCAAAIPPLVLVPAPRERIATYYQQGQPIAAFESESTSVLLSADNVTLFGTQYLRVWLLYFNRMDHPVLLDPINSVVARGTTARPTRRGIPNAKPASGEELLAVLSQAELDRNLDTHVGFPKLPYKLLAEAENAKARAIIATAIGEALQSAAATSSTRPTSFNVGGVTGTINDQGDKAAPRTNAIAQQTEHQIGNIAEAHQMFEASFTSGVLRKHTVFPQNGVNGFLYIPLHPFYDRLENDPWQPEAVAYTVVFDLPGLRDSLTLTPSAGE